MPYHTLASTLRVTLFGLWAIAWVYVVYVQRLRETAPDEEEAVLDEETPLDATQAAPKRSMALGWRGIGIGAVAVWLGLLTVGLILAARPSGARWHLLDVSSPGPRVDATIAYDTRRGKAVLFGGASDWVGQWVYEAETWEWDGTMWKQVFPVASPTPRKSFGMAYDEARELTILFGGETEQGYQADTWAWDGTQWIAYYPAVSPPARAYFRMFYDAQRRQVVLYGGAGVNWERLRDAWAWDGETWLPIELETVTPDIAGGVLVHHDADHYTLALVDSRDMDGHTWLWRDDGWGMLRLGLEPKIRVEGEAVYDSVRQQIVMFGGEDQGTMLNDTWIFRDLHWQVLDTPLSPSGRWGHSMFYDQVRERVIVFGGFDGQQYCDDMWELIVPDAK